ncbi:MAG TPA: BspA family leucine-rich repeat surface protein [Cyclobacteriaceae bacterium]
MNTIYKTVVLIALLVMAQQAMSQNFITQWNLATTGSGPTQLSIGTATSGSVNYTWQEISPGTASGSGSWSGATLTIAGLPTGATIRLQIAPTNFQRIIINSGTDSNRLIQVEQWGSTAWTSMQRAFYDCQNLQITATDVPNLSGVTNMSEMFSGCIVLNSPSNIGSWNTAAVTNMEFMFYGATAFNQNISGWNTGAVTTMSTMFSEASSFNQDIGSWNTSAVTDMSGMFQFANAFNQNIGSWNTSAVTDMSSMFSQANSFNQNIAAWNTGAATDMRNMFRLAIAFNQNIGVWALQPTVDIRNIFDDSGMDCNNYSATLIGWSANPSTPTGRTLGAIGRQYGTNAAAARTNLTASKGWTITGDTPTGTVCVSVPIPTIINFTPTSGPVGITVTINGTNFDTTPANNTVTFNGTTAVVTASTTTSITVIVPAGATTGKISVTVSGNTATSTADFTVTTGANQPPIILSATTAAPINGIVVVELLSLLSDPDDNLDLNTLSLLTSLSEQGAAASINASSELELDYGGVHFAGVDRVSIEVCDLLSACSQQELSIEVSGNVVIYNALSPNGDGKNDSFLLQYIDIIPETQNNRVTIYNRWGDSVFGISNYNNADRVFKGVSDQGKDLPSGNYFYKIEFTGGHATKTGFLSLKR